MTPVTLYVESWNHFDLCGYSWSMDIPGMDAGSLPRNRTWKTIRGAENDAHKWAKEHNFKITKVVRQCPQQ